VSPARQSSRLQSGGKKIKQSLEEEFKRIILNAKENPDETVLRNRSVSKSDYTSGVDTPYKNGGKGGFLNSVEWLIIILLILVVVLLNTNGRFIFNRANFEPVPKYFCDDASGKLNLSEVEECKGSSSVECKNDQCKPCPKGGRCSQGLMVSNL
jgi:hypothetical protein